MDKVKFLFIAFFVIGRLGYAGGDIAPVSDYEVEDSIIADEEAEEEPSYEEPTIIKTEPVYVEPQEEVIQNVPEPPKKVTKTPKKVVVPPAVIVKPKNIRVNGSYIGIGIMGAKYKNDCKCKNGVRKHYKDVTYGLLGRAGYDFNQYIGVEARASKTNWKSDGSRVEHIGAYIKPMIPIGNSANAYALIGVAKTKVRGSMPHVDDDGLALGGGIEVDLSKDIPKEGKYTRKFDGHGDQEKGVGLFVDYERMVPKKDAPIIHAVSAGVTYDF